MASLFARDVHVVVLGSGSTGNCTYVGDGHAGVLIDCGISALQVQKRLEAVGLGDAPIDAVFITHEHSDHCAAARVLCAKLRKRDGRSVPFYVTRGSLADMHPNSRPDAAEMIEAGASVAVRHLIVDPFTIPHDTLDPVAYRVGVGGTWVGVITDLGRPTTLVEAKLRTLGIAVLEFNHDTEMLLAGSYPWHLKQRIRSSHGHLSNTQAGALLREGLSPALEHLVLAHLSEENNRPGLALAEAQRVLRGAGAEVRVQVAHPTLPLRLATRAEDW